MGYKSLSGSLSLCQCRAVSGAEEGREKERERERKTVRNLSCTLLTAKTINRGPTF